LNSATLELDLTRSAVQTDVKLATGYGLGFMVMRRDTYVAFGHGGDVAGYQAALYMNREANIGVIVLANVGGGALNTDSIALRSLDILSK
jgi:CubicO group peptidase (beta-lactamase class C family)